MQKAIVLLSGGIDSTTCLALAVNRFGKENVKALNIFYGQRHNRELASAQMIAKHYGVPYYTIDLSEVLKFSNSPLLLRSDQAIKHESYADQLKALGGFGTVDTYVPFRNGLMLSVAATFAVSLEVDYIFYGAHRDDAAGRAYPDCTPEFADFMGGAIYEGSGRLVRMIAPLIDLNKAQVIRQGLSMGAPYEMTWSCYEGGQEPCGTCGTCIDREAAFAANGITDPAKIKSPFRP